MDHDSSKSHSQTQKIILWISVFAVLVVPCTGEVFEKNNTELTYYDVSEVSQLNSFWKTPNYLFVLEELFRR